MFNGHVVGQRRTVNASSRRLCATRSRTARLSDADRRLKTLTALRIARFSRQKPTFSTPPSPFAPAPSRSLRFASSYSRSAPPYSHPLSRPCSRVNVNMNFLAHGAGHFLKIFATTSFNVWMHFSTHYILQCLAPTPCEVWAARSSAPPRPLPFSAGASNPRTMPDRRRGPASTPSTGPTAGTRGVRPSYPKLPYTFSSAIQTSAAHLRGSPSNRASSPGCRSATQAPRTSCL